MTDATFPHWVGELAAAYTRELAILARREGLSADEARDAVQEGLFTYLQLPRARALVGRVDESVRLLGVVVRNAARNMRRRHHRSRPHDPFDDALSDAKTPSPEALLIRAEDRERVVACIELLVEAQRRVLTLHLAGLTGEESARALGLTPGHVAVLLHRAKRGLQRCLGEAATATPTRTLALRTA